MPGEESSDPRDWRQGPWETYEDFLAEEGPPKTLGQVAYEAMAARLGWWHTWEHHNHPGAIKPSIYQQAFEDAASAVVQAFKADNPDLF